MTAVVFVEENWVGYERGRPYSDTVYTVRAYIIRDDPQFTRLRKCITDHQLLEEVALQRKVIELDCTMESASSLWTFTTGVEK